MTVENSDVPIREGDDRDAEIARLRERVAFYESFDRVIADNVARSGELLRQAMETRSSATSEIAFAHEEAERQRAREISRQRALLSALLDDVIQLQGQAERLARRVADALDEIESELPTGEFPVGDRPDSPAPIDVPAVGDTLDGAKTEPFAAPRSLTVLAHGLPDAAAARSLREFLAGLAQVSAVEPREFAEGVLRLDVTARSPLAAADLGGWTTAGTFDPVTERDDLIEIRLATGALTGRDGVDE